MIKKRQDAFSITTSTRLRPSQISTCRTRNVFSTIRQSNRLRQEKRDMNPQVFKNVEFIDIFESHWLRNSNCIDSSTVVLRKNLNEKNSRWSNWTIFHFKTLASTSISDVEIEQSNNFVSSLECVEERSVFENYRPLYQHDIEWMEIERFFEKSTDESIRTVHQLNIESIVVELSKAIYSQQKNENVQRQ